MNKKKQETILLEVQSERDRQDSQWGGMDHDVWHDAFDWCGFIRKQLDKINKEATVEKGAHTFRERMVKVAALAVAAIEARDEGKLRFPDTK